MARTPVLSNRPIEFTNTVSGKQVQLPLGAIFFDGTTVKAEGDVYNANKAAADAWLSYLTQVGLLTPDNDPPIKPAMKVTAKDGGSNGNLIQVAVANVVPDLGTPANTKFDMTVTETDTYAGLKPGTIQLVLGDGGTKAGTQPGLVVLPGGVPTDLPAVTPETALAGGPPAALAIAKKTGAGNAFTLQAKASTADGSLTSVAISDVNDVAGTFTLTVKWKKLATGIKATDAAATFTYELTVAAPDSGPLGPPAAGTYSLSGGSDPVTLPAVSAATVVRGI